jgi:hypothetical protein
MHRLLFCDAEQLRSFPCALRLSLGEPGSDPQVYFTRYSVTIHGPADHSTCSAKNGIRQNHNAYLLILSSPRILSFQSSLLSPITSTERQPAYRHRSSLLSPPRSYNQHHLLWQPVPHPDHQEPCRSLSFTSPCRPPSITSKPPLPVLPPSSTIAPSFFSGEQSPRLVLSLAGPRVPLLPH